MAQQRPPSAAQLLYPNMPSDDGREAQWVTQTRERNDVAAAMFPAQVPKPQPASNPYREGTMSLAEQCDQNPWLERGLALAGLRRIR